MKKFFILSIILFGCTLHAQNTSGMVRYDVDFMFSPIDTAKIPSDAVKSVIVQQMKKKRKALAGDRAMYRLDFNQHEAVYAAIPMLVNDANQYAGSDGGVYYFNAKNGEHYRKTSRNGKSFRVIKNKEQYDWKISGETKKILNHTCYRATKKLERPGKTIRITAWFAPAIPLHFGPKGFNGLPGLILGLEEFGMYYEALEIKLETKPKKIKVPEGILITQDEFNAKF